MATTSVNAQMIKLRKSSIEIAIALSVFASASLFAQGIAPRLPNETVTVPGTDEARLQNQVHQSTDRQSSSGPSESQNSEQSSVSQTGIIMGTITDVNDGPVPGASVALQGLDSSDLRSVTTNENGFFEFRDVEPGRPYQVKIRAAGFSEWDSPIVTLDSGQSEILDVAKLRIERSADHRYGDAREFRRDRD